MSYVIKPCQNKLKSTNKSVSLEKTLFCVPNKKKHRKNQHVSFCCINLIWEQAFNKYVLHQKPQKCALKCIALPLYARNVTSGWLLSRFFAGYLGNSRCWNGIFHIFAFGLLLEKKNIAFCYSKSSLKVESIMTSVMEYQFCVHMFRSVIA